MTHFITFRRHHIDAFLSAHSAKMTGDVLDIGGKKDNKRGAFIPPVEQAASWKFVNIDKASQPDIEASADDIPLPDESADTIIMTELLEHVADPERVIMEAVRLLRPDGRMFITMPFLNQVHADPHDYQRWTATMLRAQMQANGLEIESIDPMGGLYAVLWDLRRAHTYRAHAAGSLALRLKLKILHILQPLTAWQDRHSRASRPYITTGWAVIARKPADDS